MCKTSRIRTYLLQLNTDATPGLRGRLLVGSEKVVVPFASARELVEALRRLNRTEASTEEEAES